MGSSSAAPVNLFATCTACAGAGHVPRSSSAPALRSSPSPWACCATCDGLGRTLTPGGPAFGCSRRVGEARPGELVELGTGDLVIVAWHVPRDRPATSYVREIDAFDGTAAGAPTPIPAAIGILTLAPAITVAQYGGAAAAFDDGAGVKDADAVDPMARRARAGDLL